MRINSEQIVALGESLDGVASMLETEATAAKGRSGASGFVGPATEVFDGIRSDYELLRVALCKDVRGLADLARQAGGCYATAEERIEGSFGEGG